MSLSHSMSTCCYRLFQIQLMFLCHSVDIQFICLVFIMGDAFQDSQWNSLSVEMPKACLDCCAMMLEHVLTEHKLVLVCCGKLVRWAACVTWTPWKSNFMSCAELHKMSACCQSIPTFKHLFLEHCIYLFRLQLAWVTEIIDYRAFKL